MATLLLHFAGLALLWTPAEPGAVVESTLPIASQAQWQANVDDPAPAAPQATATGYSELDSQAAPGEFMTLDQLKGEMKKLAWTKGDYRVVPYGILWANMAYETQRTTVGDYVFYVNSPTTDPGEAFHVDAKSTRIGLDVFGPRIQCLNCAQSGGRVEIDFQRQIDIENKAGVLLRHAYVEVKNEEFRLLAGQTWDVASPLMPGMLMYSVGWGGGNIGYRRAQFRGERYLDVSDVTLVTLQGSMNANIVSDVVANLNGDQAAWPLLEGRIGTTLGERGPGCLPIDLGVSGHVGEQGFDFLAPVWANPVQNLARRTWSFNVDARAPITPRFGVQGEFFTGENLGTFLGGILQGIDIGTPAVPGTRVPIRSTGGWGEVWYDWTCALHSHAGYGIDDPNDADVTVGRRYNNFYFANLIYDVTPKFQVGVEVTYWRTIWTPPLAPGDSVNTNFAVRYGF